MAVLFCNKCGSELPFHRSAKPCANCGEPQNKAMMIFVRWVFAVVIGSAVMILIWLKIWGPVSP